MASEIRVNQIQNRTGVGTITIGVSSITMSEETLHVGSSVTISSGIISATSFSGSAANLTNVNAQGLTGTPNIVVGIVTATEIAGVSTIGVTTVTATTLTATEIAGVSTIKVNAIESQSANSAPTIAGIQFPTDGGLSHRNILHNGDMRVTQRGTASTTASGTFPVDRWNFGKINAGTITAQQVTDAPVGFKKSVQITITTADATVDAGDVIDFQQWIEANNVNHLEWGTANAKDVTLSFWVKTSVAGTYCAVLLGHTGSAVGHSYVSEYTISSGEAGTWVYRTITVPGPTSGTFATQTANQGIAVRFSLSSGTNYHQAANFWGTGNVEGTSNQTNLQTTQGATWAISGVQLEVGDMATPFENRSYGEELANCQRYYQTTGNGANPTNAFGGAAFVTYPSNAYAYGSARFHSTMRANPTVVLYDNSGTSGTATQNGSANGIAATANHITRNGFTAVLKSSGTWFNDARYTIYCGYTASAEL